MRDRVEPVCRCAEVDTAPPGVHRYCAVHDRATRYQGDVLTTDGRLLPRDGVQR